MSMKNPKVVFNGISIFNANPDNYALKNDFLENLVYVLASASPMYNALACNTVVRGFVPKSKLPDADTYERYHCSGSALALKYNVSKENAKMILIEFLSSQQEAPTLSAVLSDSEVTFVADNHAALVEKADNSYRTIWKQDSTPLELFQ